MNSVKFLSLDLEMAQPSQKIIQLGAVAGDIQTGEILEELSCIINPHEQLSEYIIQLTGITQEDVDSGMTLIEGYKQLVDLHKRHECLTNPMTWGGGDSQELKKQVQAEYDRIIVGKTFDWPFGRRWLDVKTLYQFYRMSQGASIQAGLKKACGRSGVAFEGPAHNATKDALNTFKLAKHLIDLIGNKNAQILD